MYVYVCLFLCCIRRSYSLCFSRRLSSKDLDKLLTYVYTSSFLNYYTTGNACTP